MVKSYVALEYARNCILVFVLFLQEEIEAQKKDWELGHLKALKEEEEKRLGFGDEDSLLYCSRDASNQVLRSKRNRNRTSSNKSDKSKQSSPKRRSQRLNSQKTDSNNAESNDSQTNESFRTSPRFNSHEPKENLVNGSSNKNPALRRTNWNNIKNCEKNASSPLILKPFSNPNLVIRTRRASAIEAEEKSKSESDSELCSPRNSSLCVSKDVTNDNSTNSSIFSESS